MRKSIDTTDLITRSHNIWANQWMLLMSGKHEEYKFNAMTVAWGSIGTMWEKPFVQIVVRHDL